jgi:uncharacterized protein YecE (DUF72 family)
MHASVASAPRVRREPATAGRVLIGCSGWDYRDWRNGTFYPPGLPSRDRLRFYADRFDTLELNTTFYRLPKRSAAKRWASETPEGFTFAVKVSRYITHVVRLKDAGEHLALLLERVAPLRRAGKLGPLLWQLPPTFRRDDERLVAALAQLPADCRHAIEFRHASWFAPDVLDLLRAHEVGLVIADRPDMESFRTLDVTADFVYVRLHHGSRGRRGNYSESELEEWAWRLCEWQEHGDVFAYFNNDWEGFAPANARTLRKKVSQRELAAT